MTAKRSMLVQGEWRAEKLDRNICLGKCQNERNAEVYGWFCPKSNSAVIFVYDDIPLECPYRLEHIIKMGDTTISEEEKNRLSDLFKEWCDDLGKDNENDEDYYGTNASL